MNKNFLKLNDSKTEFLVLGSQHQLKKLKTDNITVGETSIPASQSVRNIGAIFDSNLTMKDHVLNTNRACYFQLRSIGKVRKFLTQTAAETLIHSFVASRLDQMNSLLFGIPKYLLQKLQKVQKQAARITMRTKRREHISPVLELLH